MPGGNVRLPDAGLLRRALRASAEKNPVDYFR
jgi:hypothetical protein